MTDTVKLYNEHDNLTGRDGGPYLDQVEAIEAEKRRAVVEGREPADLSKPHLLPATAGIPLVTAAQLVASSGSSNLPSQERFNPLADAVTAAALNDDFPVNVHSEREDIASPVDDNNGVDPANPTVGSAAPKDDEPVDTDNDDQNHYDDDQKNLGL